MKRQKTIDIVREAWRIVNELEQYGRSYGDSVCRDTASHFWEQRHPYEIVDCDLGEFVEFRIMRILDPYRWILEPVEKEDAK